MTMHRTILIGLMTLSCKHTEPLAADAALAPAPVTTATPGASPLSRLIPPARPGARKSCPLAIEPGVAFGPVLLGETVADLVAAGLVVKNVSDTHAEVTLDADHTLKVTLCKGKIIDIWIDDLRNAPTCVTYAGMPVANNVVREDLEKTFGVCTAAPPRNGGTFESCHDGGVWVGHGMGTFLQLRVRPKAWAFDNTCEIATDDGSAIVLPSADKSAMLKHALNLPELGKYWHVDKPGRDPLRIVKTPLVPQDELMMFGSKVVWIDESEAKKGGAFLRITSLTATKTRASLAFEYPIEGVTATVYFAHGFNDWRLERGEVNEH
jgi:hypothetical protein